MDKVAFNFLVMEMLQCHPFINCRAVHVIFSILAYVQVPKIVGCVIFLMDMGFNNIQLKFGPNPFM